MAKLSNRNIIARVAFMNANSKGSSQGAQKGCKIWPSEGANG